MPDRILYTLDIPGDTVFQSQSQVRRNVATFGAVGSGQSAVENISLDPNQQLLSGRYAGTYAQLSAAEVEELFDAPDYDAVPLFGASESTPQDGYYSLENVDAGPPAPGGTTKLQRFDGALTKEGTIASYWRAVETNPMSANNWAGNNTTAHITVPTGAGVSQLRWLNPETGERAEPTVVATRQGEGGAVDVIDAAAAPWDRPTAIYRAEYDVETVDCRVWDTRGHADKFATSYTGTTVSDTTLVGSATVGSETHARQWAAVFRPSHHFDGAAILDSGLLRLAFDEATQSLSAQQWDDANTTWSSVSLGSSDWQLYDLDIQRIGMARVEARTEWEDTTQSPTAYYTLTLVLPRGYNDGLWLYPDGEGPVPSGLQTQLDPIANEQITDPQPSKGLVAKDEVNP